MSERAFTLSAAMLVALAVSVAGVYFGLPSGFLPYLVGAAGAAGFALAAMLNPLYPLLLLVASLPFEEFFALSALGSASRLLGLAFIGGYLFNALLGGARFSVWALSKAGWLWLVWASLSLSWSAELQGESFFSLVQLLTLALLVANVVSTSRRRAELILWAYSLGALVVASIGVFNFYTSAGLGEAGRVSGTETQSVAHFAAYLLPAFLFFVVKGFAGGVRLHTRVVCLLLSLPPLVGILASGTRSAWLGAVFALLVILLPRVGVRVRLTFLGTVLMVALLLSAVPAVSTFVSERTSLALATGGAGRSDIWRVGASLAVQNPFLGVGIFNFPVVFDYQALSAAPFGLRDLEVSVGRAPHNIYLSQAVELGVVGFVLWLAWMGNLLRLPKRDPLFLILSVVLVAFLVQGFFLDILNRKYFWLVVGLAEGARVLAQREAETREEIQGETA